jgi:aspartyl-tRNA(Asn)/glutamyl-tRNA(Gln) amidotransferase subunit A
LIDNVASADAVCVSRLRGAGAIVLGKLSTHEFVIGGPSFDHPWAPARNPWNTDHHPGGSSSGSGAGLAAGLFPMALGSDSGGSVRNPASLWDRRAQADLRPGLAPWCLPAFLYA